MSIAAVAPRQESLVEKGALARFAVRFGAIYALLFFFPFPFTLYFDDSGATSVPVLELPARAWDQLTKLAVPWIGQGILGISAEIPFASTGSGDRLFDWIAFATTA